MRKLVIGIVGMMVLAFAAQSQAVGTGTLDKASGWYVAGSTLTVNAAPGVNSEFGGWLGDTNGATITDTQIVFTVDAPHSITGLFSHITWTITASAGSGGTISPSGAAAVLQGSDQAFTITPSATYHIADVLVGGSSVGAVGSYTFTNVTADGTIEASFAIDTYTLTYNAGANGSISGTTPQIVDHGNDGSEVTAVPDTGYHFVNWSDGPTSASRADLSVTSNITATANFAINQYTVQFLAGSHGAITGGDTNQTINHGSDATAPTITADAGYTFANWNGSYSNVTSDRTLTALYTTNSYTLTFESAGGTAVAPITQAYGTAVTAPAAPTRTGYNFAAWDPEVPATMPAANQTHTAQWTPIQYSFVVYSDHGASTPAVGTNWFAYNTVVNFALTNSPVITPNVSKFEATGWVGTGSLNSGAGTNGSFTITNNTTITWTWSTNYWVEFNVVGE